MASAGGYPVLRLVSTDVSHWTQPAHGADCGGEDYWGFGLWFARRTVAAEAPGCAATGAPSKEVGVYRCFGDPSALMASAKAVLHEQFDAIL